MKLVCHDQQCVPLARFSNALIHEGACKANDARHLKGMTYSYQSASEDVVYTK